MRHRRVGAARGGNCRSTWPGRRRRSGEAAARDRAWEGGKPGSSECRVPDRRHGAPRLSRRPFRRGRQRVLDLLRGGHGEATARALAMVRPGGQLAITTWGPRMFEPGTAHWWTAVKAVRPDLIPAVSPWGPDHRAAGGARPLARGRNRRCDRRGTRGASKTALARGLVDHRPRLRLPLDRRAARTGGGR